MNEPTLEDQIKALEENSEKLVTLRTDLSAAKFDSVMEFLMDQNGSLGPVWHLESTFLGFELIAKSKHYNGKKRDEGVYTDADDVSKDGVSLSWTGTGYRLSAYSYPGKLFDMAENLGLHIAPCRLGNIFSKLFTRVKVKNMICEKCKEQMTASADCFNGILYACLHCCNTKVVVQTTPEIVLPKE